MCSLGIALSGGHAPFLPNFLICTVKPIYVDLGYCVFLR